MSGNFLYYSTQCSHSLELINDLKENELINEINIVCIDNKNIKLPSFLKSVPTLVVEEADIPLVGEDAFKWIKWKIDKKVQKEEKDIGAYQDVNSTGFASLGEGGEEESPNNSTNNYSPLDFEDSILTNSQNTFVEGDIQEKLEKLKRERGLN